MKLREFLDQYHYFSGKASDVARQLAFAGIAIVWIFKVNKGDSVKLNQNLLVPTALFSLSLLFDLTHYVIAAFTWYFFHRHQEKKPEITADSNVMASPYLNWPTNFFFCLKIGSVFIGYIWLFIFLWQQFGD